MLYALWLTDIHLEFLEDDALERFLNSIQQYQYDMLWITGDIAHGSNVAQYLLKLANHLQKPIYFVLGNHDFYGRKIATIYEDMSIVTQNTNLIYLSQSPVIRLNEHHALIGHDSWGDGRWGNYHTSNIMLNDFLVIRDFAGLDHNQTLAFMRTLAQQAVEHTRRVLESALKNFAHVWMLTHVPPFRETSLYKGKIADDNWLPFFSCKVMGDMLMEVMNSHPQKKLTILCGHTHNEADVQVAKNIRVIVGEAEYCAPCVQRVFAIV